MARIRSIKPEFWTDEKIVKLTPLARLLFIGLWNFADDYGRMKFSPLTIKLQILPLDSTDGSAELGELRRERMIQIYQVEGVEYLQVVNFEEHQKVDKRSQPKYPGPPPNPAESPRALGLDQGRDQGKEGSGGGGGQQGSFGNPSLGAFAEQRLMVDMPEGWKARCIAERGWRSEVVESEWIRFRGHYGRKIGRAGLRTEAEWLAEWESWYRGSNIKGDNSVRPARQPMPGVATL
jgi:hypothetical protein